MKSSCVFGPVPSRRLGSSLGVDVFAEKTCSYDCIYCQLGSAGKTCSERITTVRPEEVAAQLEKRLAAVTADYVTISGSGEPTLYLKLGTLIRLIKAKTQIPVAVLTNGSLLPDADVRRDLLNADLVVPSLDAGTKETFQRVNRPSSGIDFDTMVEGLVSFAHEYSGKLWLEVLLVAGISDSEAEVRAIAAVADRVQPDIVHLNTPVRPPAESSARAVDLQRLEELASVFSVPVDIAQARTRLSSAHSYANPDEVLQLLSRRPCTIADIASGLSIPEQDAADSIHLLLHKGLVHKDLKGSIAYYSPVA